MSQPTESVAEEWFSQIRTYHTVAEAKAALTEIVSRVTGAENDRLRETLEEIVGQTDPGSWEHETANNALKSRQK